MNFFRLLLRPWRRTHEEPDRHEQPAIASLPAELLDRIFTHLVAACRRDYWPYDASKSPGLVELERCSLVCRSWRGPAQRRVFGRLVVKSGSQMDRVLDEFPTTGLHTLVTDLSIDFGSLFPRNLLLRDILITPDNAAVLNGLLLALLLTFTSLHSLEVNPISTEFTASEYVALEAKGSLRSLSTLVIRTRRFHTNLYAIQDLLSLTPSLINLHLDSTCSDAPKWSILENTVHLPHLAFLRVSGGSFRAPLVNRIFLSPLTLSRIEELHIEDTSFFSTFNPLANREVAALLDLCPAVEKLTLLSLDGSGEEILSHIPWPTHTLTLENLRDAQAVLNDLTSSTRPATLRNIILKDFEFNYLLEYDEAVEERERFRILSGTCKKAGVELIACSPVDEEDVLDAWFSGFQN